MFRITPKRTYALPASTFLRQFSGKTIIQEGDVVILRRKRDRFSAPILTLPLRKDRKIEPVRRVIELKGSIPESDIIGKSVRDSIISTKGDQFRIHEPSLAEYVVLSPRLVTPIYPKEAALIVELLDIHPPQSDDEVPLEIFEAGTGHGSLTLYLSRAIHAANSGPPNIPPPPLEKRYRIARESKPAVLEQDGNRPEQEIEQAVEGTGADEQPITVAADPVPEATLSRAEHEELMGYTQEMRAEYENWLTKRRAVVQTLDISSNHSAHAQRTIRGFRRGLYYPNINFHVGTIPEYLSQRLEEKENEPFLQYAILDLPDAETYMKLLAKALKPNGILLLYCPNITQINESVQQVMRQGLPFLLETVVEIGGGSGSGGREWEVKMAKTRALQKAEAEERKSKADLAAATINDGQDIPESVPKESENESEMDLTGWNMVCHPKPGVRINVGAFVAVFRRMDV